MSKQSSTSSIVRIKPYQYIHVLDNNTNVTKVFIGPKTYTTSDNERIITGPDSMIIIPPRHYCTVKNPIIKDEKTGAPKQDHYGNYLIRHGDEEIRFEQEPFPLYPGELVEGKVQKLTVIAPNSALRVRCLRDFVEQIDGKKINRVAGDEWLFRGPGTYKPKVEVQVVEATQATIIKPYEALRVRARRATVDQTYKQERKAGEEWLVRKRGAFLPDVDEEIIKSVKAIILTDKIALHLRANRTFVDVFGVQRKAGEEWLVTQKESEAYIPDVYEEVVGKVSLTTLTKRQYAVVLDPVGAEGKPQLGQKEVRKGEVSFFLKPGERLEKGIQDVIILAEDEAILLRAKEAFKDGDETRQPGDRWMRYGPSEYVPEVMVELVERRKAIPLDENEGIYVRDIKAGKVRAVSAQSYMLKPNEELWEKELPEIIETILGYAPKSRDKTRVITYKAPHNSAVQIYDYKDKKSRVVFGPDLIVLGPDEQFTLLSLSGGKPKTPNVIKAIALQLGPDFMTDVITVETSDHARLSLKLSYNWKFDLQKSTNPSSIFSTPDFVGDACKAIAARVRGAVAAVPFHSLHTQSASIIRGAVFGKDKTGKIGDAFRFTANNLLVTNIDIQSVEPVDQRTRDSLQKSVQLAIEITTKSQEATARHEGERKEQEARGRLERQKIEDESEAEKMRRSLLALQAESSAVESTGQSTAEAKARADASNIEGEAAVKQAKLAAEASKIKAEATLSQQLSEQEEEVEYLRSLDEIELTKARKMADIESNKFKAIVNAIGPETIRAIAAAGPEMQAKLLQSLGVSSLLVTDGKTPMNLFNTAHGLIAQN